MSDKDDYSIKIEDLTSNVQIDSEHSVTGSGIFDTLMETVSKHMQSQFDAGRIQGTEYSTVYLNALQATLELSTKILLSKKLTEQQVKEATARTALIEKQIEELDAKVAVLKQQKLTEEQNTELAKKQVDKLTYDLENIAPKEATLLEEKVKKLKAEQLIAEKDALIKDEQVRKLQYEIQNILPVQQELLTAQSNTEAEKKLLVKAQKVGFEADFRLKETKMLWDAWSVGFSVAQDDITMSGAASLLTSKTIGESLANLSKVMDKFPTDA